VIQNTTSLGRQRLSDRYREQIANDLLLFARLHSKPIDRDTVFRLWRRCYDGLLQLQHNDGRLRRALNRFCQALTDIPTCFDAATETAFQVDFAQLVKVFETNAGSTQIDSHGQDRVRPIDWPAITGWMERRGESPDAMALKALNPLALGLCYTAFLMAADGVAASPMCLAELPGPRHRAILDRIATDGEAMCQTETYRSLAGLTAAFTLNLVELLENESAQPAPLPTADIDLFAHRQGLRHA
jgi:hypothetical protein